MANLLQRLELNGFKSFAQRTVFDFSNGITAIVGPNGSGKSNVIDAVRWLLGEREAKNLRGVKAEDLIFAGTVKRPRLGLASASLHFENVNNFFPAEFSEIVVTRQVNRDGTNQYFLNKSEIRLRDLVDFFAQARLGTKGLIVVSQGNSDVFIQANPTGRREMIEEMLGLREYQIKKSEAERRLKNTQTNLDKVKALTEEILPHLRSLKRQTGRWERRGQLEEELKTLENEFFGSEHHELAALSAKLELEIAGRAKHLASLTAARKDADAKAKKVESSQPEERKELQEIKRRTEDLLHKRSDIQKELGRLEAQLELVPGGPDADTPEMPSAGALFTLVRELRNKLESLLGDDIDPTDFHASVQEILDDIDDVLAKRSAAKKPERTVPSGVREALEKMNTNLAALERDMASLKEKENSLEKNQEEFYISFKSAVAALESAKDAIEKWEHETQQKQFEKERLGLRLEEWERQVRQAGRRPEEFREVTSDRSRELGNRSEVERKLFKLRGELAAIGEIDEALLKEAHETEGRYTFLNKESEDLLRAQEDLRVLIRDLNEKIKTKFMGALSDINREFAKFFELMFGGGTARLKLEAPKQNKTEENGESAGEGLEVKDAVKIEEEHEPAEVIEGIEIDVKLPRKRVTSLDMLSGGERSLVGIAALFALISVSPPPFLVLDEIDAALDERNARRFSEMLKEFSKKTQFILVTHNRATMEAADVLYGITLSDDGTSKAVSLKLENAA